MERHSPKVNCKIHLLKVKGHRNKFLFWHFSSFNESFYGQCEELFLSRGKMGQKYVQVLQVFHIAINRRRGGRRICPDRLNVFLTVWLPYFCSRFVTLLSTEGGADAGRSGEFFILDHKKMDIAHLWIYIIIAYFMHIYNTFKEALFWFDSRWICKSSFVFGRSLGVVRV